MVTGLVCNENVFFDTNILVSDTFKKIIFHCLSPKEERVSDALWVARNLNYIIQEKIRKNDIKNKAKDFMENPLVISIAGVEPRVGVTHFALALAGRLNENGIKTIYEDRSGKIIKALYEKKDDCTLSLGVYYYKNILMKYPYSHMVTLGEHVHCKLIDCSGMAEGENECSADVAIIIAGGKPWEKDKNSDMVLKLQRECKACKCIVLSNFEESRSEDGVPLFCDPFCRGDDINIFFDKVISMIFEEENAYKKEDRKRIFRFFTRKKQS